jgi:hypothetical protein
VAGSGAELLLGGAEGPGGGDPSGGEVELRKELGGLGKLKIDEDWTYPENIGKLENE